MNEVYYQAALNVLKRLLKQGLITKEEYKKIDQLNVEKWKPLIQSI